MKVFSLATLAICFMLSGCGKQPASETSEMQALNENSDGALRQPERPIPGGSGQEARGATRATYGIRSFPTTLLIDRQGAFIAWTSYFNVVEDDPPKGILAGPYGLLSGVLPRWRGENPSRQEGLVLIRGLGESRFYGYSKLIKQLFFKNDPFNDEPEVRDILLYADTIDSLKKSTDEYYRMISLGKKDEAAFQSSLSKESERLWLGLSSAGERSDFTPMNFGIVIKDRFGTHMSVAGTGNYTGKVLIMGHLVDQQTRKIEQYGLESEFSYLLYDMMVSNGYGSLADFDIPNP